MGKKIGIIAMICTIIYIIFSIIAITQAPEVPNDVYELVMKDKEAYMERWMEIKNSASALYKASNVVTNITGIGGIILSIVSIVKIAKDKEKGKIIPILSIVLIVVFFFIAVFSIGNMGAAFEAGIKAGMEI